MLKLIFEDTLIVILVINKLVGSFRNRLSFYKAKEELFLVAMGKIVSIEDYIKVHERRTLLTFFLSLIIQY